MWFIHSATIKGLFFPRQQVGIRYAAVGRADTPPLLAWQGKWPEHFRARRHTHSVKGVLQQLTIKWASFPLLRFEKKLCCDVTFQWTQILPLACSTKYRRSRLGYFTLTFTDDLVMTCIIYLWEYPGLIVLKLLLYILCEEYAFLRLSSVKLLLWVPTNKFRVDRIYRYPIWEIPARGLTEDEGRKPAV